MARRSPQRTARCCGPPDRGNAPPRARLARRKDGTQVAVSYSSAPVDLTGGRGAVVAFRDISDRLRLGEVQASRARIAKAADDARRTIERDLHDGAQQQFVAVAMRLGSVGA